MATKSKSVCIIMLLGLVPLCVGRKIWFRVNVAGEVRLKRVKLR